jgi:tetratricopeptide (TPR) repeat protein
LPWLLAAGCVLITLIGLLLPPLDRDRNAQPAPAEALGQTATTSLPGGSARPLHAGPISEPGATAEQIVTNKVAQFARSRRAIARALARNFKVEAPAEVERFFDFAEAGRWDDLKSLFKSMLELRKTSDHPKGLEALWPALHETYGVAEAAHDWPAQKLLDYGQAVLGSLRPGMVYVGGTDPGRFIPTLLNETTDGERHVVLTQNAFADGTYLDYVDFLYADRLATLTKDDSQQAFQDYLADATKRAQHDQQFPYQPRQLKPGEDVRLLNDGGGQRVQVSGQVAVMAINEKLLQTLMGKNPDVSFALEESFPLKSTYADAAPLGPLMELRAQPAQNALTAESAAQTVDYWRATAQQLLSDPEASASPDTLKAYAKLAVAQGNLLRDRKYDPEAEQAYRLATELAPASPEAVFNYVQVLTGQNRIDDALSVAEAATKLAPENPQFVGLLEQLRKVKKN